MKKEFCDNDMCIVNGECTCTDFNRNMSQKERDYYGKEFDENR